MKLYFSLCSKQILITTIINPYSYETGIFYKVYEVAVPPLGKRTDPAPGGTQMRNCGSASRPSAIEAESESTLGF